MQVFAGRLIAFATLVAGGGCMSTDPADLSAGTGDLETGPFSAKCEAPDNQALLVEDVLAIVNQVRRDEGLSPLDANGTLDQAAGEFACEMIEQDFFAHENPDSKVSPGERLTHAGYIFYAMGENLAVGQPTPVEAVAAWLQSPPHRANILSPDWRETGIAVRNGGAFGWYWVQEFAEPIDLSGVSGVTDSTPTVSGQ